MPTTHTNGTKSRPKANPYDHTHPLNKAANAFASGIDDPSLEQRAKVTSELLNAASSLEDSLYRVMYPELEQQDQQKGQYE